LTNKLYPVNEGDTNILSIKVFKVFVILVDILIIVSNNINVNRGYRQLTMI